MGKIKTLLKLFISTFSLSAFTFGGGYVIVSFMKKKFVDSLGWIEEDEMLNLVAIAQSSPGALAINASLILGYRIAGPIGALVSIIGTALPPLITLSVISLFYTAFRDNKIVAVVLKGMQAGVAATIADVVTDMSTNVVKEKNVASIFIMVGAFIAAFFFDVNVVLIILICGVLGALQLFFGRKKAGKDSAQ